MNIQKDILLNTVMQSQDNKTMYVDILLYSRNT